MLIGQKRFIDSHSLLYILLGALIIFSSVIFQHISACQNAEIYLNQWIESEYVAIQEGNLISSVSKFERVGLSEIEIDGAVLVDLNRNAYPLLGFGNSEKITPDLWDSVGSESVSKICGFLRSCAAAKLPTKAGNLGIAIILTAKERIKQLMVFSFGVLILSLVGMKLLSAQHMRIHMQSISYIDKTIWRIIGTEKDLIEVNFTNKLGFPLGQTLIKLREVVASTAKNEAIARTTQMLAHDVRKPFTLFKMIIDMVEEADDPYAAQSLLKETLPDVHRAMASVNGMISDVMEVGGESKVYCESANPETLLEAATTEIFRVYPESDVTLTYNFTHTHKVSVDTIKIGRVFSNIVGNALQAMNYRGNLWFKTRQIDGGKYVEFCLGNSGSFIPPSVISSIFEAFFTSEKKGGTGLGLAISKKIILAHGGKIWCESSKDRDNPDGKVEFFFTLPSDIARADLRSETLPESSRAVNLRFEKLKALSLKQEPTAVGEEVDLEKSILKKLRGHTAPMKLLIIDDEAVYRNGLASLVTRSEDLSEMILIQFASDAREALQVVETFSPFLVVSDVDLGANSLNGLEITKDLREKGFNARICIHSNRFLVDDYRIALEAGANAVVPKPMSRAQFLKIILEALGQESTQEGAKFDMDSPPRSRINNA